MSGQQPASSAFLSVRVPGATRDRLKAAAAARGESVQTLVGSLVDQFLASEATAAPSLPAILSSLRKTAPSLRERGVTSLFVFGSVARGEARAGSDIDLLADFAPGARLSLIGLASLRSELSDCLGAPADLVDRASLHPEIRAAAANDAVQVF